MKLPREEETDSFEYLLYFSVQIDRHMSLIMPLISRKCGTKPFLLHYFSGIVTI